MSKLLDLTGHVFGRLTVKKRGPSSRTGHIRWWCECSCGNSEPVLVYTWNLRRGTTVSCGCWKREVQAMVHTRAPTGGNSKAVRNPDGTVYRSVKAASRCFGMPPEDIARWCRDGDYGWRFLPDD